MKPRPIPEDADGIEADRQLRVHLLQVCREAARQPEARRLLLEAGFESSLQRGHPLWPLVHALCEMERNHEPADYGATVAAIVHGNGQASAALDEADLLPATTQLSWYIDQVRDALAKRQAAEELSSLSAACRNGADLAEVLAGIDALRARTHESERPSLFEEIDVRTALREGVPPVRFDLAPYLPAGTLTLISGPPKSAKTWLALAWSICLVTGRSFCDIAPDQEAQHRILFLEAEYPRQIIIRFGELCAALQVNPDKALERIRFIRPRRRLQLEDAAQARALVEAAQAYRATMVVIDSLRRVHSLDENSSLDMANLADGALLPLRGDQERTVLVIDHDAKAWQLGNRPKSQRVKGSIDKLASCDHMLHVERHEPEGQPRRYELSIGASRVVEEDGESLWMEIQATRNQGIAVTKGEPMQPQTRRGRPPAQREQAANIIRAEKGRNPSLKCADAIRACEAAGISKRTALTAWTQARVQEVQEVQE